ncbi:MAG TPA: serine/threonine-protein kinase [Planctomycetota bacterium]|nr:serine/threonine-protein kinase [Planctomycetota bacterium]
MPQLAEAPDPFAGTVVGRYRLREKIGAGPHAAVYLASPPSGNEPLLAFKLFSAEASADPEFSARCFDAAESARRVTHPSIVKVLEVGRQETRGYVLMEYVPGGSLEKLLETEKRLSFDRATRIVRDVALALEAAKAANLFHLNLRPTNIFFGSDGRARLSDFGQGWQPHLGHTLKPEEPIGGPVEYMSPEQFEGQLPEPATDLYSLGVIYYRMLTGKLPFPGVDDREIAMKRVTGAARPIRESFPGVDPRAIPVVEKLLARRPEARFQSARALLASVEGLVKGKTSTSHAKPSPQMPSVSVIPSEVRIRLSFSSVATHFGPGLALLAVAGSVAPGGSTFLSAIGSLFTSTVGLAIAAAGLAGLAVACFLMRRELRRSGRARVVLGILAGSAASVLIGTLALDRALWSGRLAVLFAPVNLLLAAGGLAWFGVARSMDQDEHCEATKAPKICLGLAVPLWFLGWGAAGLGGPFRAMGSAPWIAFPLVIAMAAALGMGFYAVTDPTINRRIRRLGVVLLGVGAAAMALWASAGAAGTLGMVGQWPGALLGGLASLPPQIPRSGAPAILALGLVAVSDITMRGGLILHYAKK